MGQDRHPLGCFLLVFALPVFVASLLGIWYGVVGLAHKNPAIAEEAATLLKTAIGFGVASALLLLVTLRSLLRGTIMRSRADHGAIAVDMVDGD